MWMLHPALQCPGHDLEEGEGGSEAKAHGMRQQWGILASMRLWAEKIKPALSKVHS